MICFRKVREEYGWLSNMSPHPVGVWRTAEALFQAMRFKDQAIITEIHSQKSPMAAKLVAKKHLDKMVVTPRSPEDLDNMRHILRAKLMCNQQLIKALLETGDQEIVEDVTNRPNESGLFWGKILNGPGENTLGKLWMELRAELRTK